MAWFTNDMMEQPNNGLPDWHITNPNQDPFEDEEIIEEEDDE